MKKNIVALAVAAAISAPVAMAGAPTVYGKLNFAFVDVAKKDGDAQSAGTTVNSIASRLGVKGSEDLGNGLKAIYKVEFGITPDKSGKFEDSDGDKSNGALTNRNQYVGLKGGFGTVLLGRHDTPEKMSQASDLFNDGAADLANNNMVFDKSLVNETRASDVVAYVSPSFSGVKVTAAMIMGANDTDAAVDGTNDAMSAAISYGSKKKGLYLAAAMTDNAKDSGAQDTTRLSAQYKANGLTGNVIYIDSNDQAAGNAGDATVTQLNVGYKIGKFMPKAKMSMVDPKAAGSDSITNMAYGLNYSLGKKTTAYIEIVDVDKDNTNGLDTTSIGMIHKF